MKACRPPRNIVSNSFQIDVQDPGEDAADGMLAGARLTSPAIRPSMMPPAKMLPKSRRASVIGLTSSSRMFSGSR